MSGDARPELLLRNGVIATEGSAPAARDILVSRSGRILAVERRIEANGVRTIDLQSCLVSPGFVDMHQHLDKSFTVRDAPNPNGTLLGAIEAFKSYAINLTCGDIIKRAQATVDTCLARGTTVIRTHANIDCELKLRSVEAMCDLKERNRERIHIDIVAFITSSAARGDLNKARDLLEQSIAVGADTIGGTPNLAPNPAAFIDMLLDAAERHDRRIDLHIDETLDPRARWLDYLASQTRQRGFQGRVVGSHACSLSVLPDEAAREAIEAVAEAGIGICTLPSANLFLQGRDTRCLTPRGLTRVVDMLQAGIPVATASDNIQDAFVPIGSGDMLEHARWTILSAHLLEQAAERAHRMITVTPAEMVGLGSDYGLRPGAWADLVVTQAADVEHLVASGPLERAVLFRGRVVAGTLPTTSTGE